jgi:hypothetical protein
MMHFLLAVGFLVSTLAGSGAPGVRDGDATSAEFMKPIDVATDAQGDIYVADAAAQRIREVSPSGYVTTLAGSGSPMYDDMWVDGGYQNGPASQARFNRPSAVAVGPDGGVYVADSLNHCVRLIKDGIVSTYAGAPDNTSADDGPLATASFRKPRALAFNAAGDLYVADIELGIRRIHDGTVTTLKLPVPMDKSFLSIAFSGSGKGETMFVGTSKQLVAFDRDLRVRWQQAVAPDDKLLYFVFGNLQPGALDTTPGLGIPYGVTPDDGGDLIYADTRSHAVRALDQRTGLPAGQPLQQPLADAADYGGGYRDGDVTQALFDAPMGIARLNDGRIVVADTGNRRIRVIAASAELTTLSTPPPFRDFTDSDPAQNGQVVAGKPFHGPDASYYRIAYLGNSYAFFNTSWSDSIPGRVEAALQSNWKALGFPRPPKLISISPIQDIAGFHSYISNVLSLGVVDAVLLQFNSVNVASSFPLKTPDSTHVDWDAYDASWEEPMRRFFIDVHSELAKAGIPLVVVTNPVPAELTPLEVSVFSDDTGFPDWMFLMYGPPGGQFTHRDLQKAITGAHVPEIDLFPGFLAAEQDPNRVPLNGTVDGHYSQYGRALAARLIVQQLIAHPFWVGAPKRP